MSRLDKLKRMQNNLAQIISDAVSKDRKQLTKLIFDNYGNPSKFWKL